MSEEGDDLKKLLPKLTKAVADKHDAEILLYSGPMDRPHDDQVIEQCRRASRRENIVVYLTTYGGDADAAYRIARFLQRKYKKVTIVVAGFCKSAGTLLVLGATELVMLDHAELGPLDVQLSQKDELGERRSGLAPLQAFNSLDAQVQLAFEQLFVKLNLTVGLTARTAGELAGNLVGRMYSGIYAQVDPMRLGEMQRALNVAEEYGKRLVDGRQFAKPGALTRLVARYPSHGFVIDYTEARELFYNVREASDDEAELARVLHFATRTPLPIEGKPLITLLERDSNAEAPDTSAAGDAPHPGEAGDGGPPADARGSAPGSGAAGDSAG